MSTPEQRDAARLDYGMSKYASLADAMDGAIREVASLRAANAAMEEGLRAALTAFSEMHHARTNPDWFTRGKEAADAHWFTWERKGIDAVKSAIERAALAQKESA